MSVWNYVVTAHKPTNVTQSCVVGNFTSPQELNLITAKCTRIEISLLTPQGLQPMLDVPIYGRIATLELFRPHGEAQDFLFIATERYKFCVLQWDSETSELIIRAMGDVSDRIGRPTDNGQIGIIDPDCRLIGLHLYDGLFKVEREVDMSNFARWETAEASEMTPIKSSSPPVVTDSLCNVEPERSQVKKRKKKSQKVMQDDAKSGSCGDVSSIANSSLPGGLCLESEVYIGTKSDLKSGQTSEMTPINDTSGPVVTNSSQSKKKKQKQQGLQDPQLETPGDVSSIKDSSLQRDSPVETATKVDQKTSQASETTLVNYSSLPAIPDALCYVDWRSLQKMERQKKVQGDGKSQDPQLETPRDVSSIKDSSLQRDSPVETATKVDQKTSQASETTLVNYCSLPAIPDALCYVDWRTLQKMERQKKVQDDGKSQDQLGRAYFEIYQSGYASFWVKNTDH